MATLTPEQESEVRVYIETALQEGVDTDYAGDFALDRYYDAHGEALDRSAVHQLSSQYEE